MANLWIFGDSYGVSLRRNPSGGHRELTNDELTANNWIWYCSLAKRLGCENTINFCMSGVSNDYILHQLTNQIHNIEPNDYVIVISTSVLRKWFFEKSPELGNFYTAEFIKRASKGQYRAIMEFTKHLDNPILPSLDFCKFLWSIHFLTDQHQWNLLVLPGFEQQGFPISHNYQVKGTLVDICFKEFDSEETADWFYQTFSASVDVRPGHLSRSNHEILSEKLFNTLTANCELDLTSGFHKGIISPETIEDYTKTQIPVFDKEAL